MIEVLCEREKSATKQTLERTVVSNLFYNPFPKVFERGVGETFFKKFPPQKIIIIIIPYSKTLWYEDFEGC